MSWKPIWNYITGNVKVTVQAIDHNEDLQTFTFTCFLSREVNSYDRLDSLSDVAHHMSLLRNYYHAEIIDIEELPQ